MPRFAPRRLSLLAFALGVAACAADGGRVGEDWEAVVDTVGDTVVVHTLSGSVWGEAAHVEAEVTIGMLEGPDEYLIGDPRSLAVGPDGVIYVLDRQVPVIRAYGPDGKYLRDVGREGGGPGEYKAPGAIATLADGRLLVRDPGNGRITIYSGDGEYLEQLWYPGGFNTSRRMYVDRTGFVYSLVLLEWGKAPWDWKYGLARIDPAQGILDTVPAPTFAFEPAQLTASREGSSSSRTVPFSPTVSWTFSPLGYAVGGVSTDYRIDLFRAGEPVLRIERDFDAVPVKADEAEEQRRRVTENLRRQYPGWQWNGPAIPGAKPPFRDVITSWEGDVWVQLSQEGYPTMTVGEAREEEQRTGRPQVRYAEPAAYDVFAPTGQYLGRVRVPESFRTDPEPIIRGRNVWAVTRDELDVATVVRFRITYPNRATAERSP